MKVFIYDHEISNASNSKSLNAGSPRSNSSCLSQPNIDYYISINYKDETESKGEDHIHINDLSKNLDLLQLFENARDDLIEISNSTFRDRSVKKIISFNDISLWWFYEIAIRISYFEYLRSREMLKIFFDKTKISSVVGDINDSILLSALRDCCAERGIPLEVIAPRKSR
ncbi:MAG TPA: hypothetical protein VLY86_02825, partial [Methanothrix sp.]|nr:hypothetical protein [Methanothrix sp.]